MSAGPVCVPAQAGTQGGREELLRVGKYLHQQGLLLPANTCSPEQTRQMLRCSALHIQSQTLWQRQEPCDDQRLWHLFVATIQRVPHTGVRSTSPSPILHTGRAGGSAAGNNTGTVDRTSRCPTRCDTTGHCGIATSSSTQGWDESQGKDQMCWQLRGVSQPLSSPRSVLSPHMGCKPRTAKRREGLTNRENPQAQRAGREV